MHWVIHREGPQNRPGWCYVLSAVLKHVLEGTVFGMLGSFGTVNIWSTFTEGLRQIQMVFDSVHSTFTVPMLCSRPTIALMFRWQCHKITDGAPTDRNPKTNDDSTRKNSKQRRSVVVVAAPEHRGTGRRRRLRSATRSSKAKDLRSGTPRHSRRSP